MRRDHMKRRKVQTVRKATCFVMSCLVLFSGLSVGGVAADTQTPAVEPDYGSYQRDEYALYLDTYASVPLAEHTVTVNAQDYQDALSWEEVRWDESEETDAVLLGGGVDSLSFPIQVPREGMYTLRLQYNLGGTNTSDAELALQINGEYPFDAASRIVLKGVFQDRNEVTYDTSGNQIRPSQKPIAQWQNYALQEMDGLYDGAYVFYFPQGEATVTLTANKGQIAVASLTLCPQESCGDYTEPEKQDAAGLAADEYIKIQGEEAIYRSDSTLYAVYDRSDSATEPSDPARIFYNTIGQANWQYDGQWIEWEFEVKTAGYYEIGVRLRNDLQKGFKSNRRILIDGMVPFAQLECVSFDYDRNWYIQMLGEGDKPYTFYLDEGPHTIRMEVVSGPMGEIFRALEEEVYKLDYLYRSMIMVTGTSPDTYRDYYLDREVEGLLESFSSIAVALRQTKQQVDVLMEQNGGDSYVLEQMATLLESMVKKPRTIATRLDTYKSYVSALSGWMSTGRYQPLEIDYLFVKTTDVPVPQAREGFFSQLMFTLGGIVSSYFVDYNSIGVTTETTGEAVKVWTSTGREQAQVIRELINNSFQQTHTVGVKLSLVQGGLLEATLAGKGPDVALYVGGDLPVNLAARNALVSLDDFDGIEAVKANYQEHSLVPFTYKEKLYGLPLTQDFPMLFVRKDVLADLGVDTHFDTWEDFFAVLPTVMRNNMQVGLGDTTQAILPTGSGNNYGYSFFTTQLLQNGGNYYTEDLTKTRFSEDLAVEAFTKWTEFYTMYSFDVTYDFLNRFRTGEMPIAISSYTVYNTLMVSAPEIRGLWEMLPIPGTADGQNGINRAVNSAMTTVVILKNDQEEACWEFVRWFTSNETQTQYAIAVEALLGTSGRYTPANTAVLNNLGWSKKELSNLSAQQHAIREIPAIPAAYSVTRGINNAFRKVVYSLENPRETLLKYDADINKEIRLKWKEFGVEVTEDNE